MIDVFGNQFCMHSHQAQALCHSKLQCPAGATSSSRLAVQQRPHQVTLTSLTVCFELLRLLIDHCQSFSCQAWVAKVMGYIWTAEQVHDSLTCFRHLANKPYHLTNNLYAWCLSSNETGVSQRRLWVQHDVACRPEELVQETAWRPVIATCAMLNSGALIKLLQIYSHHGAM